MKKRPQGGNRGRKEAHREEPASPTEASALPARKEWEDGEPEAWSLKGRAGERLGMPLPLGVLARKGLLSPGGGAAERTRRRFIGLMQAAHRIRLFFLRNWEDLEQGPTIPFCQEKGLLPWISSASSKEDAAERTPPPPRCWACKRVPDPAASEGRLTSAPHSHPMASVSARLDLDNPGPTQSERGNADSFFQTQMHAVMHGHTQTSAFPTCRGKQPRIPLLLAVSILVARPCKKRCEVVRVGKECHLPREDADGLYPPPPICWPSSHHFLPLLGEQRSTSGW